MKEPEVVGLQLELLHYVADKYEPDVAALSEEYHSRHGEELAYARVYNALEGLSERGLLEKKPIDGRSKCYMLTNEGVEFLAEHRNFVLDHLGSIREALE